MSARPSPSPQQPQIFVHTKREEWGRAAATRGEDEWQSFVFEDGQERRFGRTHLHLLAAVSLPAAEHATVLRALLASVPAAVAKAPAKKKKSAAKAPKKAKPPAEEREESGDSE